MAEAIADQDFSRLASAAKAARHGPKVMLHIGEPKTGTTFLQHVLWRNRAVLAAHGVILPGTHPQDHFRASQDLTGVELMANDPDGSWTGEWEILAEESKLAPRLAVISHELFAAADERQVKQAVTALSPAEVHVVLTVRDIARLLPAEWQESVKHRSARSWEDWLGDVIDREASAPDRRQHGFWQVHDTLDILATWSGYVPPQHVHVITAPPRGSNSGQLWRRFAGVLGVDPDSMDLSEARTNESLGLAEIEFLRRLNEELPAEVPDWFYMWRVKEEAAHESLAKRPAGERLTLPGERLDWARQHADKVIAGLRDSGYDLVGDLDDLRPGDQGGPAASPSSQPAERLLDAAVFTAAALVLHEYWREFPAEAPEPDVFTRGTFADRLVQKVAASQWLKKTVRDLSSRHSLVRRLRIIAWRALERPAARTKSAP
jgi:hypothetical protein